MTSSRGPNAASRRLRAELRSLREECGLSVEEASTRLAWASLKLVGIENGQVAIPAAELDPLFDLYCVQDPHVRQMLLELARVTDQRMWWQSYDGLITAPYLELISAEADASRITHFHPIFVPGLLQTRSYATDITPATTLKTSSQDDVLARVEVRMRRQREVLHRPDPVQLTAVLDEAVLRRRVGSNSTMREQLDHLATMAEDTTTKLAVVPLDSGPHPALLGTFMLIEYDDPRLDAVLFFEGLSGDLIVRDRPELAAEYRRIADRLVDVGLRGEAAARLIRSVRRLFT
jgi:hypothetical protein